MKPTWRDQHQFCSLPSHREYPQTTLPDKTERLTLQRTEATVHHQLEITQLTLSQDDSGKLLGFSSEFGMAGGIAGEEVLEDTTVRRVGHCEGVEGYTQNRGEGLK